MHATHPYTLAIDTALGCTSLALGRDGVCVAHRYEEDRQLQASHTNAWIEALLEQQQTHYQELGRIITNVGPGGFTGLRIGLAAARAIGHALNIPVLGFTTLDIIAYAAENQGMTRPFTTLLPAGRKEVFIQRFQPGSDTHTPASMVKKETLSEHIAPSDKIATSQKELGESIVHDELYIHDVSSNAQQLLLLADSDISPRQPSPLYIKPPDAVPQQPLTERR